MIKLRTSYTYWYFGPVQAVKTSQRHGLSVVVVKAAQRTVVIGLAADSGMLSEFNEQAV